VVALQIKVVVIISSALAALKVIGGSPGANIGPLLILYGENPAGGAKNVIALQLLSILPEFAVSVVNW
jgi:hypothetical protein